MVPFRCFGKVALFSLPIALLNISYADDTWYAELNGGYAFYNTPNNNVEYPSSDSPGDNYASDSINNNGLFGGGFGYQFNRTGKWFPAYRVGFSYHYFQPTTVNGKIYLSMTSSDPDADFSYKFSSQAALAVAQLDIINWQGLAPFISVGGGLALNKLSDYQDSPVLTTFSDNQSTNFAYQLGLGINYHFLQNWSIGIAYYLDYLGEATTGSGTVHPSNSYWSESPLTYSPIYINEIGLNIRYFI